MNTIACWWPFRCWRELHTIRNLTHQGLGGKRNCCHVLLLRTAVQRTHAFTQARLAAPPSAHLFPRRRLQDAPNLLAHPVLRPRPSRYAAFGPRGAHQHAAAAAASPATATTSATRPYSTGTGSCRKTARDEARASRATVQGLLPVRRVCVLPMLARSQGVAFNSREGGGTAAERS